MKTSYKPELNKVQLHILTKLITHKSLRYTEMQPEGIENDLYNYHLQYLVSQGMVDKDGSTYSITDDGVAVMANADARGEIKSLFKVSVALYVLDEVDGKRQVLAQKRGRRPFLGDVATVSGKVHWGEPVEVAAKRKLKEETGLDAEFKFVGVFRKTRKDGRGNFIEDTIYHICVAEGADGDLERNNVFGENYWLPVEEFITAQKRNVDVGEYHDEVTKKVVSGEELALFYYHQVAEVESY